MIDDMNGEIYVEPPFQAVIVPPEPAAPEPETVLLVPEPAEPETVSPVEAIPVEELPATSAQVDQDTEELPFEDSAASGTEIEAVFESGSISITGMGELLQHLETLEETAAHPMLETPFEAYTVTEGLLLLIFIILFLDFFLNLLRRWF